MSPADVEMLAALCRTRAGLSVDPTKTYLIESRLAPLARREEFPSIGHMIQALRANRDERLVWAVVEAMTLNETAFFRDRAAFAHFRDEVLPRLSQARGGAPVRIWSAACSTGQEAYCLAMIADEVRGSLPRVKVDILGSDLSERRLEKAQAGLYTQFEVQRGLPIRLLVRHFTQEGEMWALSPRIRQMVRWRAVNLMSELADLGQFDVVFCRNVLSALEPRARGKVVEKIAALMPADGVLVLGARETLDEISDAFAPLPGQQGVFVRNAGARVAA